VRPTVDATNVMPAAAERPSAVFPQTGHAFLRRGPLEVHLNCGDLGYLSIAAHAHADALSVAVRYEGEPIVVDPGTFTYRGGSAWREWLVSTPAHATVTLDGRSQAERLGPFLWGERYAARLAPGRPATEAATGESGAVEAGGWHDGYRQFQVIHRRTVRLLDSRRLEVEDILEGAGRRHIHLTWPLGPGLAPINESVFVLAERGLQVRFSLHGLPGPARLEQGDPRLPATPCVAPGYDDLDAALALVWEGHLDLPARWTTRVQMLPT